MHPTEPVRTGKHLQEAYTRRKDLHRREFVPFLIKILRTLLCCLLRFGTILRVLCSLIHCSISSQQFYEAVIIVPILQMKTLMSEGLAAAQSKQVSIKGTDLNLVDGSKLHSSHLTVQPHRRDSWKV